MGAQRDINEVEAILLNYIRIPKEKRNISLYDAIIGLSPVYLRFLYKGIIINHNKNRANLH